MPTDDEKWARRRAARRGRPAPEPLVEPEVLTQPPNFSRAFRLWQVYGLITFVAIVGIVILLAAINMRAGYRGARGLLTFFGALSFLTPVIVISGAVIAGSFPPVLLIPLALSALPITATILMWQPDVSDYMRAVRA